MTVHYVSINGRDYDVNGAQRNASADAWRILIDFNGMNPFRVNEGMRALRGKESEVQERLAGPSGTELGDVIMSLVFLAMHEAGDTAPDGSGRPIMPQDVWRTVPLIPMIEEFMRAGARAQRELLEEMQKAAVSPKARTTRTDSVPGNRAERRATKKKK